MFETFQTIINAGGYDLADLTQRIKTMYVMGELTEEEMKQLLEQAQTNAKPDESYAPLADRVKAVKEWETTIEERLNKLESGSSTDTGTRETRRQMAGIQAADRCARRLPRRRQNHLQREALHVHLRRVRVASGHLPAGVAGRGMICVYTGPSK